MFITIEGIDGTGKTTVITKIQKYLEDHGKSVWVTSEPTEGQFGRILRERLKESFKEDAKVIDALIFATDRVDHQKEITAHLEKGEWVLSDRYKDSSIAYQTAQGLEWEWVETINTHSIDPDLTILLDMEAKESLKRRYGVTSDENLEKFESEEFLTTVQENFVEIATREPHRVCIVDASQSEDEVFRAITTVFEEIVSSPIRS